jgi:hypothetical protein
MTRRASSSRATFGAVLLGATGLIAALLSAAPRWQGLLIVAVGAWFAWPGVLSARRVYLTGDTGRVVPTIIGATWGYGASSIVLLALWVAGLRSTPVLLIVSPLVAGAVLLLVARRGSLEPPALCRRDVAVVALLLLVVPLVVARPFSRVGELTPEGRTYRAYFNADFVWRMAVAAEVAHGVGLPKNQFYRGDDLRYYWAPDLLSAVEYRSLGRRMRLEEVLLANALVVDVLFVAFLYAFVRHWTPSAAAAGVATAAATLLGSFEGTERIVTFLRDGTPLEALKLYNIDAITRWVYGGLPVDGLHRILFWKPQHAMGYALGLSSLLVVWRSRDVPGPRVMVLAGLSLALALFFSSFSAIMIGVIVGVVAAGRFVAARRFGALVVGVIAAAIPIACAAAAALALHYVDRGESLVRLLVNPQALHHPYISITLSFGAMLPAAIVASIVALRRGAARMMAPLWVAIAVLWFFYFFVDVRDHQYVYVGWRAGDLLFIVFSALAAYGLTELWQAGSRTRLVTALGGIVLALAALPTVMVDVYNTQDTGNRRMGPGFRWTLVVSNEELAALDWIKRFTPPDALVQVEPAVRGRETWAYIPAFAERRMSAGLPISMVPVDKYVAASAKVTELYRMIDARAAFARARELGIDYLVIAPQERAAFPRFEALCDGHPELFRPVFRNQEMAVYFIERDRPAVLP